MFENEICDKYCKQFSISFKIKSYGLGNTHPDFYIGYATGENLEASIIDWQEQLGEGSNVKTSKSWGCYNGYLHHSDELKAFRKVKPLTYSIGDELKMVFNFESKKVKFYHNDTEQDCQDLIATKIWIGLSFAVKGETVEMIHYKYE